MIDQVVPWSIFCISTLLFGWMFLGYPLFMWLASRLWGGEVRREPITPSVTVIVCTYNEANTIGRRLSNLLASDYPPEQLEILVVDSDSPDGTADIVKALLEENSCGRIKLLREDARRGKVSAINMGLAAASGEIVILTDGPTVFWPDTMRMVIENFADPSVGAVTGNFVKYDLEGEIPAQETEWLVFDFRKKLRRFESAIDSTTWLSGELTAIRRSVLPTIPYTVIIDDAYIAMAVREKGYRVVVDERANYSEKRPSIYTETVIIKKKSVAGSIQEMVRFRKMLLNPRYRWYGMFILPARVLHFYLNPLIFLGLAASGLWLASIYVGILPVLVFFVSSLAILALVGACREGKVLRPLVAFILMEWIIIVGLFQYITGDYSAAWQQVATTRSEVSDDNKAVQT